MILGLFLHAVYATIASYLLAHLFGRLSPSIAIFSLVFGLWLGFRHARRLYERFPDWRLLRLSKGWAGHIELVLIVFILYASIRHFTWLLFPLETQWATLSANNLGDLPMHLNFIRAFAGGVDFPPLNPIFASESLRYPYGSDLYNALWESIGVRTQAHLFFTGVFATLASLTLLRAFAGWWGIGAFFLNGGVIGWQVLNGARLADFQGVLAWKNLFLSVFLTQRGMLFALPIGLVILRIMRDHFAALAASDKAETPPVSGSVLTIAGLLWGFLPLFHLHSFVVISLMIAGIAIEYRAWRRLWRSRALWIAFIPAVALILHSTAFFKAGAVAHWRWGWTLEEGQDFFAYLILNFGPWLMVPPAIAAMIFLLRKVNGAERTRRLALELGTSFFLFALFFNLILAPWEWDNIKLLIWPYLGFARLLWVVVDPHLGKILGEFERPLIAFPLFLTGVLALSHTLRTPLGRAVPIYPFGEVASAEGALQSVPMNAVFASAGVYNHPLTFFGRLRAVGYDGHLWSHGINSRATADKLERVMKGDPEAVRLAREIGVTHIFWGPEERRRFANADSLEGPAWIGVLKNVSRVPEYGIYEVK